MTFIEKPFSNKAKKVNHMKKVLRTTLTLLLLLGIIAIEGVLPNTTQTVQASLLQQEGTPQVAVRPLLYIVNYNTGADGKKNVSPWGEFTLEFTLGNNGKNDPATGRTAHARNIVMTFSSNVFDPLDGSVKTIWEVDADNQGNEVVRHKFKVNEMSAWMYSGTIVASTTYSDDQGVSYSDTFTFTITIDQKPSEGSNPVATPTTKPYNRPQMIIHSYETDVVPLQPGSTFKLKMSVSNGGNADARAVSVVFGGGVSAASVNPGGTPEPQGLSGGAGDTSTFAPLGSSNVVLLGDMVVGAMMTPEQSFIVNVSATPGAYPFKVSFIYTDPSGARLVDDAIITLLVHTLPQLDITFYRPVEGSIFMDMGGQLPVQITNLGKKSIVLGNVTASSQQGTLMDNTMFLGTIEPGGYQTFDPFFMPMQAGPAVIDLSISYTDDFNQVQTYQKSLEVYVEGAMPTPEPFPMFDEQGNPVLDEEGNPIMIDPMEPFPETQQPQKQESFFAKLWNALKAFFGIKPASEDGMDGYFPIDEGGGGGGGIYYKGG